MSDATYIKFGYIGTAEVFYAEAWNTPKGATKIIEEYPGVPYVLSNDGTWQLPNTTEEKQVINAKIKQDRRIAILSAWPLYKQNEALTEAAMGDSTKLDMLTKDIAKIKEQHPYVD